MAEAVSTLVERLRAALGAGVGAATHQALYEHWVSIDRWPLQDVAPALLVGVSPEDWRRMVEACGLGEVAAQLEAQLRTTLEVDGSRDTTALRLRAWAERQGVALPAAAEQLLDFVARTLPRLAVELPPSAAPAARGSDKEAVLGAALALVTRFTEDCLDDERMFDGARIARLMLAQSALWFPDGAPRMDEKTIAALIEHYISGF